MRLFDKNEILKKRNNRFFFYIEGEMNELYKKYESLGRWTNS